MFHGFNNEFLYTAIKIETTFDVEGKRITVLGTCFFVLRDGKLSLITNRHLLDYSYKKKPGNPQGKIVQLSIKTKIKNAEGLPVGDLQLVLTGGNIIFHKNYFNDVAAVISLKATNVDGSEYRHIDQCVYYDFIADNDLINACTVCDFVAFPGFPEWHDKAENRPILRTGAISSDPRFNYSYNDIVKGDCIAYEAFSFSGSSGSPVFALQRGYDIHSHYRPFKLIGINAGHLPGEFPGTHSGISYFYKSTIIIDLLNGNNIEA